MLKTGQIGVKKVDSAGGGAGRVGNGEAHPCPDQAELDGVRVAGRVAACYNRKKQIDGQA
jgi:hypothetical protein